MRGYTYGTSNDIIVHYMFNCIGFLQLQHQLQPDDERHLDCMAGAMLSIRSSPALADGGAVDCFTHPCNRTDRKARSLTIVWDVILWGLS